MSLKKAKFVVMAEGSSETITCCFNPSQYTISNKASYSEVNTSPQNTISFQSVNLRELKVTLYFSSVNNAQLYANSEISILEVEPVTKTTQKIIAALNVNGKTHCPPLVAFQWGNLDFQGYITSAVETYTMFDRSGKPIRCKMDLDIKEFCDNTLSKKKEPFSSPDRTKWTTMTESMSLWQIAYQEYGDTEKWRLIANANQITNPLQVKIGQMIKIPAL